MVVSSTCDFLFPLVEWGAAASPDPIFGRLRVTERRESFVMRAIRCPRGSSSARGDLIEITSPPPGGARRRGRHGAHRAMYVSGWQRGPSRAAREGQSRGCGLALAPPARTPARSWPPIGRRSPFTAVLVIYGLPRREQSWSPSTDGLSGAIRCGAREATWSTDRAGRRARHQRRQLAVPSSTLPRRAPRRGTRISRRGRRRSASCCGSTSPAPGAPSA